MPEVTFTVQAPDGAFHYCYSPSTVVKNFFSIGDQISAAEFIESSRLALTEASERVRAKFGFSCSSAASSLAEIEQWAGALPPKTPLTILHI